MRLALARERIPLEYTPKVVEIPTQISKKDRRESWKWNKIICKYSASAKFKKLQKEQRKRRSQILDERRGLTRNEFNLGILLNITEEFIPELSMDDDQRTPSFQTSIAKYAQIESYYDSISHQNKSGLPQAESYCDSISHQNQSGLPQAQSYCGSISHQNQSSLLSSSFLQNTTKFQCITLKGEPAQNVKSIYTQAETLVKATFAKYDVLMDLNHTLEDGFTCDILLKGNSVVAVQEFVLMKKYVWLESLIVSDSYRRQGIGKLFVQRLIDIGRAVRKSILLYSLIESLPFYFSCGFQLCPQCEYLSYCSSISRRASWFILTKGYMT